MIKLRRLQQAKPEPDLDFNAMVYADRGVSTKLRDLATWEDVDYDFQFSYWLVALEDIDERLDKQLLIQMLRQNKAYLEQARADYEDGWFYKDALTPRVRIHLAKMWERYDVKPDWVPDWLRANELSSELCRKLARWIEAHEFRRRPKAGEP